jgi:hypothetical protein
MRRNQEKKLKKVIFLVEKEEHAFAFRIEEDHDKANALG